MQTSSVPFILDNAVVEPRQLPLVPALSLYLMADHYPIHALDQLAYERLMQQPPYWAFCWGGGQALARWIADNPQCLEGRDVVDFGAGSGVAGISAALAGAKRVLTVDVDADALIVCGLNAALNAVSVSVATALPERDFILLAADVAYEEAGFAAVVNHIESGGHAIIAESRLRNLHERFPALSLCARYQVRTFPDLDESEQFDEVHIYATSFYAKSL